MIGGSRKRVLSLAAREADIVSIANVPFKPRNEDGLTPEQEAQRRLGYVRDAAGPRFAELDLENSPYYAEITGDHDRALAWVAKKMNCPAEGLLEHPNVLIGTHSEVVERLRYRREALGINYVTVPQPLIDSFAPIAAELVGS
jgi:hypothetical protein